MIVGCDGGVGVVVVGSTGGGSNEGIAGGAVTTVAVAVVDGGGIPNMDAEGCLNGEVEVEAKGVEVEGFKNENPVDATSCSGGFAIAVAVRGLMGEEVNDCAGVVVGAAAVAVVVNGDEEIAEVLPPNGDFPNGDLPNGELDGTAAGVDGPVALLNALAIGAVGLPNADKVVMTGFAVVPNTLLADTVVDVNETLLPLRPISTLFIIPVTSETCGFPNP
jgi:hypothetical protein